MSLQIIERSQHGVSRKDISPEALKVLYRLQEAGYKAYLAGGSVRDLLLRRKPKDFDIATDAHPNQVKRLFRNCRLVGRRFRLAHVLFHSCAIEVSTFRALLKAEPAAEQGHLFKQRDGLILRDNVFGTPEEDAWRRDFTVNALFYNIADYTILDYVEGLKDLEARLLRVIGDPSVRFGEDPVRMIRALRFAGSLDFQIEDSARAAIFQLRDKLALASRERMYEEFLKIAFCGHAEQVFRGILEFGFLGVLFPELAFWMKEGGEERSAWCTRVFRQVDVWKKAGVYPEEPLLWALFFGEYHEALAAERERTGARSVEALVQASMDHMLHPQNRVQIPRKVVHATARIMAMQSLLERMAGQKGRKLLSRPFFGDAFVYFKFAAGVKNRNREQVAFWTERIKS